MKRRIKILLLAVLLAVGAAGCGSDKNSAAAAKPTEIVVFAAASTTDAMNRIAKSYLADTGVTVRLNLAASSTLAKQIEAAGAADVYLSANQKWMGYLAERDLISSATRIDLLANRLVLVTANGSNIDLHISKGVDPRAAFEGRLAMGDPAHVPAGRYGREALEYLGWWDLLEESLAPAADVRAALRMVETGQCSVGIVYSTDAAASTGVSVAGIFPPASHSPIRYPAAVCSASEGAAREQALNFIQYLQGDTATEIFAECGFECLSTPAAADNDTAASTIAAMFDSETRDALCLSAKVGLWCAFATLVPGVLLGWLLARKDFYGKDLVSAMVHAPLVVPPVVVGYAALLLLGANGPVGRWLNGMFGFKLAFTWMGAVVVAAIMAMPLMVRSVRLAIELVDTRLEHAAATLGSGPWRVFFTVTLPLAAPGVIGGLVLAFARSLGEFGATITFAGNIAGQTRTLPLAIYSWTQTPGGDGRAMALAAVSVTFSLAAIGVSEYLNRRLAKTKQVA